MINRQVSTNGSVVLTLTTITLRKGVLTVNVAYRNTSDNSEVLTCLGNTDPAISSIALASGKVICFACLGRLMTESTSD